MTGTHPSPTRTDPELIRVGTTIRTFREARGLSQEQLGHLCQMSRCSINNIEAGRRKASTKALARIADALRVPQIVLLSPAPLERIAA